MRWSIEANGLLSDRGYFITRVRMSRGWWHNAFSPKNRGAPIASGRLEHCLRMCQQHADGELYSITKRKRPSTAAVALAT